MKALFVPHTQTTLVPLLRHVTSNLLIAVGQSYRYNFLRSEGNLLCDQNNRSIYVVALNMSSSCSAARSGEGLTYTTSSEAMPDRISCTATSQHVSSGLPNSSTMTGPLNRMLEYLSSWNTCSSRIFDTMSRLLRISWNCGHADGQMSRNVNESKETFKTHRMRSQSIDQSSRSAPLIAVRKENDET